MVGCRPKALVGGAPGRVGRLARVARLQLDPDARGIRPLRALHLRTILSPHAVRRGREGRGEAFGGSARSRLGILAGAARRSRSIRPVFGWRAAWPRGRERCGALEGRLPQRAPLDHERLLLVRFRRAAPRTLTPRGARRHRARHPRVFPSLASVELGGKSGERHLNESPFFFGRQPTERDSTSCLGLYAARGQLLISSSEQLWCSRCCSRACYGRLQLPHALEANICSGSARLRRQRRLHASRAASRSRSAAPAPSYSCSCCAPPSAAAAHHRDRLEGRGAGRRAWRLQGAVRCADRGRAARRRDGRLVRPTQLDVQLGPNPAVS